MVKSMTGYGFSSIDKKNFSIEVETKSLNSKFFDFNLNVETFSPKFTIVSIFTFVDALIKVESILLTNLFFEIVSFESSIF